MSALAPFPIALRQRWELPARPRAIVIVGAGGIVNDAHLPAYRACGFEVAALHDTDRARAEATARRFGVPRVLASLDEVFAVRDAIVDVAVPPEAVLGIVERATRGAALLIQKPLGRDLAEATAIRRVCREKRLVAAVNFQLRFSPMMLALRDAVLRGLLGRVVELEVRVNCRMPWELWPFLASLPRMELALHSIHYLDSIRGLLGEPRAVWCRTVKHPDAPKLASSRSTMILDYADDVRCALTVNHHHGHGPRHEASELRVEGLAGAAVGQMGVNLDYPRGRPDFLELALGRGDVARAHDWRAVPLEGSWFPDAFRGPMSNLQRFVAGEDAELSTSVEDAWRTMQLVEALYASDARGGTPLPRDPDPAIPDASARSAARGGPG
ncbi:MAG: Gfo/Idh/MocA family oxidoreductase [Planctomycetes bacterium]|nr:Gfo/Idh/MocA family oxidoreductase [Planctomycetota bacterium]